MNDQFEVKTIKQGETLRLVLKQTAGLFADVTGVSCVAKTTTAVGEVPPTDQAAAATLTVTEDEPNSSWYIVLNRSQSESIGAAILAVDVKIDLGAETDYTDTLYVIIEGRVT